MYEMESYTVAVIGAGHAGVEAALSCARMGCKTVLFTISLDQIANMPCNPSIGGTAKGHLVREIDALGGEMGKAADACFLQSRMLNRGKGPAVHSLRVQADRVRYHNYMKQVCEQTENLYIKQAEVAEILVENGAVCGVVTTLGAKYAVKAAIVATGTYLNGRIHVGTVSYESGPDSALPSRALGKSLQALGLPLRRFKTGTPCRVHSRSIDFDRMEPQDGDAEIVPFSFATPREGLHNTEKKNNTYRSIYVEAYSVKRVWTVKVFTLAFYSFVATALLTIFVCGLALCNHLGMNTVISILEMGGITWLMSLAIIPISLFCTHNFGLAGALGIGFVGFVSAPIMASENYWILNPYSYAVRSIVPITKIHPNGIVLENTSNLLNTNSILLGILSAVLCCMIFTYITSIFFAKREGN